MKPLDQKTLEDALNKGNIDPEKIPKEVKERPLRDADVNILLGNLIEKGIVTETKELYGMKWELSSINQGDALEAQTNLPIEADDVAKLYYLSVENLARSIISINGFSVYEVFQVNPNVKDAKKVVIEKIRECLYKFPTRIVDDLFTAYSEVAEKANKAIEQLKKK